MKDENKLTIEQLNARVKEARHFSLPLDVGQLTSIEVSISSATADKIGFEALKCTEDTPLFRKIKNGTTLDGYYVYNGHCPQAISLEEAEKIAKVLLPSSNGLLEVINAKFRTEFQNKVRACLNAPITSKKAIKEASIQEAGLNLASGKITQEEFAAIVKAAL